MYPLQNRQKKKKFDKSAAKNLGGSAGENKILKACQFLTEPRAWCSNCTTSCRDHEKKLGNIAATATPMVHHPTLVSRDSRLSFLNRRPSKNVRIVPLFPLWCVTSCSVSVHHPRLLTLGPFKPRKLEKRTRPVENGSSLGALCSRPILRGLDMIG